MSLIELLVVVSVFGILAAVGALQTTNNGAGATRALLDELEGAVLSAHKACVASGQDVTLVTQGNWDSVDNPPLSLVNVQLQSVATDQVAAAVSAQLATSSAFQVGLMQTAGGGVALARQSMEAGVTAASGTGSTWWDVAMGTNGSTYTANADINGIIPFNSTTTGFQGLLTPEQNLFQGGATQNQVVISGYSKRFMSTFYIQVVGLHLGQPFPGSAMGLLVVQNNGASVYKFYNPGVARGNGKWRRI